MYVSAGVEFKTRENRTVAWWELYKHHMLEVEQKQQDLIWMFLFERISPQLFRSHPQFILMSFSCEMLFYFHSAMHCGRILSCPSTAQLETSFSKHLFTVMKLSFIHTKLWKCLEFVKGVKRLAFSNRFLQTKQQKIPEDTEDVATSWNLPTRSLKSTTHVATTQ